MNTENMNGKTSPPWSTSKHAHFKSVFNLPCITHYLRSIKWNSNWFHSHPSIPYYANFSRFKFLSRESNVIVWQEIFPLIACHYWSRCAWLYSWKCVHVHCSCLCRNKIGFVVSARERLGNSVVEMKLYFLKFYWNTEVIQHVYVYIRTLTIPRFLYTRCSLAKTSLFA